MPSTETELALKLWVVFARAHAAVAARAQADVARHGLTLAEFGILEALHHKGPLLLNELKEKILVSSGGITYLVDRLERRGLVRRERCQWDRRAFHAVLTDAGTEFVGEIFPGHAAAIRAALAGLDEEEQRAAVELLRRLGRHAAR